MVVDYSTLVLYYCKSTRTGTVLPLAVHNSLWKILLRVAKYGLPDSLIVVIRQENVLE